MLCPLTTTNWLLPYAMCIPWEFLTVVAFGSQATMVVCIGTLVTFVNRGTVYPEIMYCCQEVQRLACILGFHWSVLGRQGRTPCSVFSCNPTHSPPSLTPPPTPRARQRRRSRFVWIFKLRGWRALLCLVHCISLKSLNSITMDLKYY